MMRYCYFLVAYIFIFINLIVELIFRAVSANFVRGHYEELLLNLYIYYTIRNDGI